MELATLDHWDTTTEEDLYTIRSKVGSVYNSELPTVCISINFTPKIDMSIIDQTLLPESRLKWDKNLTTCTVT
jgi:hypothetical protein